MNQRTHEHDSGNTTGFTDSVNCGLRATRDDAPFPEEHVEVEADGVWFHRRWIPATSTSRYITAQSALNLRSPQIGGPGDWHGSLWWCPASGVRWKAHFAEMSDRGPNAPANAEFAEWLGETELADARSALAQYRHPAAGRPEPVHCATHIRAIVEQAWALLRTLNMDDGAHGMLAVLDPTSVARWVRAERDWLRLHALAKQARDELVTLPEDHEVWEAWRLRQCPEGLWTRPDARWTGD